MTARYRRIRDDSDSFVNKYLAQSRGTSQEAGAKTSASMSAVPSTSNSAAAGASSSGAASTAPMATRKISDESQYPSGRSRYAALKDRKSRVARSKSSAVLGFGDASREDDEDDANDENDEPTPFTSRSVSASGSALLLSCLLLSSLLVIILSKTTLIQSWMFGERAKSSKL